MTQIILTLRQNFLLGIRIGLLMFVLTLTNNAKAQAVTGIMTDFNGYWSSASAVNPNNRHNLIGFTYNSVIYSTGVNDVLLGNNNPVFTAGNFRAFPIGNLPGNTQASYFLVVGNAVDGSSSRILTPELAAITTKDALVDGVRGLDLGTSITNISPTVIFTLPINGINIAAISDDVPDILFANVGTPSATDSYELTNINGIRVGNAVIFNVNSPSSPPVGNSNLDLFAYTSGIPVATALPLNSGGQSGSREIRVASIKLSQFGINAGNASTVAFLKITPGGGNDPAFIAYNANAFSPQTVWEGDVSSDWNTKGNWLNEIIPTETIDAFIPVVGGSFVYPVISSGTATAKNLNIAANASVTVSGSGVVEIAGVISNSGTLNAIDGSISMIGKLAQTISAATFTTSAIKNLTINNSSGVTLIGALNLTGVLTSVAGNFTTGNLLTLKSTASKTAVIAPVFGTLSGTMTIERYIPAKRAFRFLSSPTDGGTIRSNWMENGVDVAGLGTDITGAGGASNGFDISGSNNPSLFTYLNNNPGPGANWNAVTSANISQVAGVPYRMLVRGDRLVDQTNNNATATATTLRTKGTIKYGDVSVADLNPVADGFNLIGNPYQSPVNMYTLLNDVSTTGIKKTFYTIWDPNVNTRGGYVTVTFAPLEVNDIVSVQDNTSPTNTGASRYLQPGQAAFVQTQVAGAPSLIFKENQKALSFSNVFRQANDGQSKIRFTLYTANALANGNSAADGFVVTFDESDDNAANEFDAIKAVNQDESLGMMNSEKIYSFQRMAMPMISDVIPLSSVQYRTTDYTFRVAVEGLTDVTPMLLDKYTQTTTELVNDNTTDVNFTVDPAIAASTDANRFDIIFQETALGNTDNVFGNAIRLYPNPSATGNFFVALPSQFAGQASVEIVSLLGQKVFTQTTNATSNVLEIQPTSQLQAGVYFVNVTTAQGKATKKLIIK